MSVYVKARLTANTNVSFFTCFTIVFVSAAVQQSFIDVPTNSTVVQGETVVIQCSVANRKGAVQWTQGGLALGMNKLTPVSCDRPISKCIHM